MMPVPPVAGEPGGVKAQDGANLTGAEAGDKPLEAGARHGSACGAAEIVVNDLDIAEGPGGGRPRQDRTAGVGSRDGLAPGSVWTVAHTPPPCGSGPLLEGDQRSSSPISLRSAPEASIN